jgi:hypothetical protein
MAGQNHEAREGGKMMRGKMIGTEGLNNKEAKEPRGLTQSDGDTMIFSHVLRQGGSGMKSPLDCL